MTDDDNRGGRSGDRAAPDGAPGTPNRASGHAAAPGPEDQLPARILATDAVAIAVVDPEGHLVFANPPARRLLGCSNASGPEGAAGARPEAPDEIHAFRGVALTGAPLFDVRLTMSGPDGGYRVLSLNAVPMADVSGEGLVTIAIHDLTEQYDYYERALRESEQRLKLATEAARIGVWELCLADGTFRWDPLMCRIYGVPESEAPSHYEAWLAFILPEHQDRIRRLDRDPPSPGERRETEFRIRRKDGRVRYIRAVWQCLEDGSGEPARLVGTNEDVTEQRELQEELEYRAAHDPLTDLCNRAKIQQLMRAAQAQFHRHGTPFALLLFDVDHFKQINDHYGHAAGDAVLWHLARRIESVLREDDQLGRWGGEEFMIVASHADEQGALALGERVRRRVCDTPFEGIGYVTISIGIATADESASLQMLERRVDRALYAAKTSGRNRCVSFASIGIED